MHLTVTVIDPEHLDAALRHVTIEAAAGTPYAAAREPLCAAAGCEGASFSVAGVPLSDDDRIGVGPLVRGAMLTVTGGVKTAVRRHESRAVELRVVSGVDAGRLIPLGRGEHVIGRAASSDVRLDDPGISRAHAIVAVRAEGITVRDLGTTNPSRVDGGVIPPEGAVFTAGQHLRIGSTTLVLGPVDLRSGRHELVDGEVRIHRQPRFVDGRPPASVTFPAPPTRPERGRVPLLASFAPLALSAALAIALSSPALLLFALMSPVLLLGQWWSDRRAGRTSYRRQLKEHGLGLARARQSLAEAAHEDAVRRRREHPDLGLVASIVDRRATRLWERRPDDPDHLVLRIGSARQPAQVELDGADANELPQVDDVPALVDVGRTGVLGVAGPRDHTLAVAGALVLQVAVWHTPRWVSVHVLAATPRAAREWEWAAHLPHVSDADETAPRIVGGAADVAMHVEALRALAESRRAARDGQWSAGRHPPEVVVVLDGASALRSVPGITDLLRDGPDNGLAFVCLDDDATSLPSESHTSLEIDSTGLRAIVREDGRILDAVVPDLPSLGWLEEVSRAMAPLVDATPESGAASLPREVSFVDLHRAAGIDPVTTDGLETSWASGSGRPTALIGRTPQGPFIIDLAKDGPHVLVGGTTGSGKSELLQALVAGLAVTNRPDELAFVLVDYKGGSAFSDCARLPHTVGLVTDLDARLTARALTSLDAEMKRRERLLAEVGAKDLHDYRRAAAVCGPLPPLARLVIVVDEFKALAEEFPDFVAGLVRVAALGRSLGLHLVLATQRPAGIVSADMRANVALRIALRVRDRADSVDVIDAPDSAGLDPRAPGRAFLRAGDHGLTALQTAYLGRSLRVAPESAVRARAVARDLLADAAFPDAGPGRDGATETAELSAVVEAAAATARRLGIPSARPPWLPALPTALSLADLADLADLTDRVDAGAATDAAAAAGPAGVPLGLVDVPDEQRREMFTWHPSEGQHLGIAGGPRSGRSTALVALALGLALRSAPEDVHVHVLQGVSGPCASLDRLPHVGTVADATDPVLCRRLVSRLARLVDGEEKGPRHTVVLVDGWETLEEALSGIDHGTSLDVLHRLLRDGPSAGVHFVVAGGRAVLSGRLPGLLPRRLVLHMPDPLDLTLAGVAPPHARGDRPPGRAIDVHSGHEVQLALPGSGSDAADTVRAVEGLADALLRAPARPTPPGRPGVATMPWRMSALPDRVDAEPLAGGPDHLVIGIGGDDSRRLSIPMAVGRRLLVAGPSRSGRSSALVTLGEALLASGRSVLTVCPRRSPLSAWAQSRGRPQLSQHDAADLVAARRGDPDVCILVDDGEAVDGSPAEPALVEAVRLVDGTRGVIAVAADLARANVAFRGLVPEIARDGCGLLLQPSSSGDGDVLGAPLGLPVERRPGRGYLVLDGTAEPIQVGHVDLVAAPTRAQPTQTPTPTPTPTRGS